MLRRKEDMKGYKPESEIKKRIPKEESAIEEPKKEEKPVEKKVTKRKPSARKKAE